MSYEEEKKFSWKAFYIGYLVGATFLGITRNIKMDKQKKELVTKEHVCNVLIVDNGNAYRRDNVTKNGTNDETFEVSYQDEQTLVIYVYEEDELERKGYTDYIASNISIDEDNHVYFDREIITDDGYEAYCAAIINSNEEKVLKKTK